MSHTALHSHSADYYLTQLLYILPMKHTYTYLTQPTTLIHNHNHHSNLLFLDLPLTPNLEPELHPNDIKQSLNHNNTTIILTQPKTQYILANTLGIPKYTIAVVHSHPTNHLNAAHQPLRTHYVLMAYYSQPTFHPPLTPNADGHIPHQRDVLYFQDEPGTAHAKPLELLKWIVQTYTNPGDTVLDPFMGIGRMGVACVQLGRKYIGGTDDEGLLERARHNIGNVPGGFSLG